MRIEQYLLGAILGGLIFLPMGYIIRVWLSQATESAGRSPCVDEIYDVLGRLQGAQESWGTSLGVYKMDLQAMESKLTLMSNEMADFFDKTRKSEERARGHARRVEAAGEDGEDTSDTDQQLLELMESQREPEVGAHVQVNMSRDEYYKQERP